MYKYSSSPVQGKFEDDLLNRWDMENQPGTISPNWMI